MGVAIAASAWSRGAHVDLVSGPLSIEVPAGPVMHRVESTADMAREVGKLVARADVLIMAAAPADYRPGKAATSKIKKGKTTPKLDLEETTDILRSTIGKRKKGAVVVGFALETDDVLENGKAKLKDKLLDLIVVNDATESGAGFNVDTNRVTLIGRDGKPEALPLMSKTDVADAILDRVEQLRGR